MEFATQHDAGEDGFGIYTRAPWLAPSLEPLRRRMWERGANQVADIAAFARAAGAADVPLQDVIDEVDAAHWPANASTADHALSRRHLRLVWRAEETWYPQGVRQGAQRFDEAWQAAYSHAKAIIVGHGAPSPSALARAVALAVPALPPEHVADAAVMALHHASDESLLEGAYAEAEAAAHEARGASAAVVAPLLRKARQARARDAREDRVSDYLRARSKRSAVVNAVKAPPAKSTPVPTTHGPRELAFHLATEPGLLGDLARWFDRRAYRPVEGFALAPALATGAAIFGRRLATPTRLGLNLYLVGTADTTAGKDALVSGPEVLLAASNLRNLKGPGDFSSDAAIEKAVRLRPCHIMCIDEFGKLAQGMYGRTAPHFIKLAAKSLLALYPISQPGREWTGKEKAGQERDAASDVVFSPTVSILGVSTPEGLFENVPDTVLRDGTLNRITLFVGGKAGPRQRDPARGDLPGDMVERIIAAHKAAGPEGNLAAVATQVSSMGVKIRDVPWASADAEAAFIEIEDWQDEAEERGLKGLAGRAAEQTLKIATIRAAFRSPSEPAVTSDDIAWGFAIVHKSIRDLETGVRANMANGHFEEVLKATLRVIESAGPNGIAESKLVVAAGVSRADDKTLKQVLDRLQTARLIYPPVLRAGRGGVMGKRFIARSHDQE